MEITYKKRMTSKERRRARRRERTAQYVALAVKKEQATLA
jgi:hypothetical protein